MLRRFASGQAARHSSATSLRPQIGASSSMQVGHPLRSSVRQFHSVFSIMASLAMCTGCMLCFGSWANNFCNVAKYGRWRFRNTIDDVIMVSDFRGARYLGAFIGFLFWWFVVGPQKYRWNSNLADVPGNKRFGPF